VTAEPGLAVRIEGIRQLAVAGLIGPMAAAELIERVHEAWDPVDVLPASWPLSVHELGRMRLLELQAWWLMTYDLDHRKGAMAWMPAGRDQLIAAIRARVS
jgi:hypothetical protein